MRWLTFVLASSAAVSVGACRSGSRSASGTGPAASVTAAASSVAPATGELGSADQPTPVQPASSVWSAGAGASSRMARCGWGPLKVDPGVEAPAWGIALVDLEVKQSLEGLHVTAFELSTPKAIVTKMGERATLRVQDGATSYSYGAAGTHEVDVALGPGTYRLRAAAALDQPRKVIAPHKPTRCTVVLADGSGAQFVASSAADPEWENE